MFVFKLGSQKQLVFSIKALAAMTFRPPVEKTKASPFTSPLLSLPRHPSIPHSPQGRYQDMERSGVW